MTSSSQAKIKLFLSMSIFGTIGIFRNYIPLPSSLIAAVRGVVGMLFLLILLCFKKDKINTGAIKKNILLLSLSGIFIGINWILLFEAYRYTTVSTATLCYYMAPVFVILVSPFVLKEKFTLKKAICTLLAIVGMIIISGVFSSGSSSFTGIFLGLGAAVLYATVIILNKFIKDIPGEERTMVQLGFAGISLIPYFLLTEDITVLSPNTMAIVLLIVVGIIHTGIAYTLYFGSIEKLSVQTAAIFSYIDPVVALLLSALILNEEFTILHFVGSILILGAAFINEIPLKKEYKKNQKNT